MRVETRTLHMRQGTEGPRYDPYSFTKYIVEVNGTNYELHIGFNCFFTIGDKVVADCEPDAVAAFTEATGLTPRQFEEYYNRLHPYFEDPMGSPSSYM